MATYSGRSRAGTQGSMALLVNGLKRFLIGTPLRTAQLAHERLSNFKALAVFSSDALSSVAYATEEILLVLMLAGNAALSLSLPIAAGIATLLVIVALSYRQTIFAYPSGGGAYLVAKENLGTLPGLTAGAALLIDYILTVAVSIAAGTAAITSAFPALLPYRVLLAVLFVALVTLANLRGVKESGTIFAAPTYLFIGSLVIMLAFGLVKWLTTGLAPAHPGEILPVSNELTLFLALRAFASGCTALTGVEAISNGVQAFQEPVSRNAAKTLTWMILVLGTMFLGITLLGNAVGVYPVHGQTVMSQLARSVFGATSIFYFVIQAATAMILILAANTAYADFPRLASLIAKDGFLPRQLSLRGDRLVFSNGIVVLGVLASLLIIYYHGDTHSLIPLYAVGVFLSFTLSQSGMVIHWLKEKATAGRWLLNAGVNGFGAFLTFVVLLVIGATKFTHGAWIIIVLIPLCVLAFRAVRRHYDAVAASLRMELTEQVRPVKHTIIVPVAGVNKAVLQTVSYALSLSGDVRAVHVSTDPEVTEKLKGKWAAWNPGMPLTVVPSPYRSVIRPLLHYVDKVERREKDDVVTVLVPEFVPKLWWHHLLHNHSAFMLKAALYFRPHTAVISMPYHLAH